MWEGIDTACKLVILANAVFGLDATYNDVEVTGITKVTPEALEMAYERGHVIKLIGEVSRERIHVAPRLVPINHPLAVGGNPECGVGRYRTCRRNYGYG